MKDKLQNKKQTSWLLHLAGPKCEKNFKTSPEEVRGTYKSSI